jgi:hypothetical protein
MPGRELIADLPTTELADALAGLLPRGLPATETTAGDVLPNLRSVYARAVHPDVRLSRIDALNELLPKLIGKLTDENYAESCRCLFGLAKGTRRAGLMERRRRAGKELGYTKEHVRKVVEAEILSDLAELVRRDLLRYKSRVQRAVETLEPTGSTPRLGLEDLTAEEELISRIWQHVYGLRAELIAHLRLVGEAGYEATAEDHRQAANRQHDELQALIKEYVETYGKRLIEHGETEYAVEALERLAGWRG